MKVLVVAGTHAGVGKTTFCVGLMGALRQRGLVVQAFKVGPDQLDPLLHEAATGRPSYNLDGYLLSKHANVARVAALAEPGDVDVAVVEGGESLFDADDAVVGETGSTGQMAKWLGAPVVLVCDCDAHSARGVAAVVRGHVGMDDELAVAGVVLNKLESAAHEAAVREALAKATPGVPVLGALRRDAAAAALGPSESAGDPRDAFAAAAARAAAALGAGGGASIGGALVGLGNAFESGVGSPMSEAGSEGDFRAESEGRTERDGEDARSSRDSSRVSRREGGRNSRSSVKTGGSFVAGIAAQLAHVVGEGVDLNAVLGVAWPFVPTPAADERDPLVGVGPTDVPPARDPIGGGREGPLAVANDTNETVEIKEDDGEEASSSSRLVASETARRETLGGGAPTPTREKREGPGPGPGATDSPSRGASTPKRTPSKRGSLRGTLELVGNVASHLGPALRLGRGVGAGASHLLPRPLFAASGGVRIGVARDAAFCHYFRDNLLALERAGAELAPFSPIAGDALPPNCKGLLFGGGYPELYARELANNRSLRAAVTAFAAAGGAVYGECGGLAFLSQSLGDGLVGSGTPPRLMCGLAPFSTRVEIGVPSRGNGGGVTDARVKNASGYVCVTVREGCPLFPAGAKARGYVRRRSAVVAEPALCSGPGVGGSGKAGEPPQETRRGGHWFAAYDVFRAGEEEHLWRETSDSISTSNAADELSDERKEGVVRAAVRAIESASKNITSDDSTITDSTETNEKRRVNDVPGIGRVEGYAWRNVVASYVRLHFGDAPELATHFVDACRAVPQAAAEAAVRAAAAAEAAPPPVPTGRSSAPSLPQLETFEKRLNGRSGVSPRIGGGGSSDSLSTLDSGRVDRVGPASPARARNAPSASSREHSATSSSADLAALADAAGEKARALDALGGLAGSSGALSSMGNGSGSTSLSLSTGNGAGRGATDKHSTTVPATVPSPTAPLGGRPPVPFHHRRSQSEDVDAEMFHNAGTDRRATGAEAGAFDDSLGGRRPSRPIRDARAGESRSGVYSSFHRSHSAASFSSAATNAHSPNTAHLELEAFLSFPPISGSQVGLASLNASHSRGSGLFGAADVGFGDPNELGNGAHLHTPAATPQPVPDAECAIASLSPAATEIVHALGLQSRLACVTDRCDYPATVARAFPIVLRSREPRAAGGRRMGGRRESISTAMYNAEKANATSANDAEKARAARNNGGGARTASVSVDVEWLRRSRPGLVLAQDACGRCVGGSGDGVVARALAAAGLLGEDARGSAEGSDAREGESDDESLRLGGGGRRPVGVLALDPQRLGEVLETVNQVGAATGERDAAAALVGQLRERLRAVAARVAPASRKPRVLSLEGLRPFAVGGHWLPEMKQLAGGADELQEPGAPAVALRWEQVLSYAPEVLVLAPCVCGSPEETLLELERLAALPGWWAIPAVRDREVYVAHHAFFSRAGPRLVVGVELLAKMLHPSLAADVAMPEGHGAWKMRMDPGKRCRPRKLKDFFHEWKGGGVDGWGDSRP
jgi:cobyrinic acid a,c-diamide synthase/ABC-type Fe3+-hydroxamate transport system substrate-binding protein